MLSAEAYLQKLAQPKCTETKKYLEPVKTTGAFGSDIK